MTLSAPAPLTGGHDLSGFDCGEPVLNEELAEWHWRHPSELGDLATTEGLAAIVASAYALIESGR